MNDTLGWRYLSALGHGASASSRFTHFTNMYPVFGAALSVTFDLYAFVPAPLTAPPAFVFTAAATLYLRIVQRA